MNRRYRLRGSRGPRVLLVALLLGLSCGVIFAQGPAPSDSSELDGLFTDNGTSTPDTTTGTASGTSSPQGQHGAPAAAIRPDDPTQDQKIHYYGSVNIYGLFGMGWSVLPDPANLSTGFGNEANGSFAASLGFEVRPAPQLRIRGTLMYNWPSPGPQLSEMIVDYSVRDAVFFRIGIFGYTWGISQFFQFSNLPARSIPGWGVSNQPLWQKTNLISVPPLTPPPVSAQVTIPFGLASLTLLGRFDAEDYGFPNPSTPDPRDAGWGAQFSFVTGPIEWTLAGFWQKLLTPRSSVSMKTSFLGFDFSAETTMAYPVEFNPSGVLPITTTGGGIFVGGVMQRIYPTAMLGLSREWADAGIKAYVEYAYNGERDPGISWLVDETGPGGHNTVLGARLANLASTGIAVNVLWQHCWSDGSGLISPLFEISPVPLTTLQFGPVFAYGPAGSETVNNRLVPGGKQAELLLLVRIGDSYSQ